MVLKVCKECGRQFEAQRSSAVYCSAKCRKRANRAKTPVPPNQPPRAISASFDDVADALDDARAVSNRFAQLSVTAPRPLRPGCGRIGDGIAKLIRDEEW